MDGCATTRLCLVRHGETNWNAERRFQGQLDIELNAEGRRQALQAGAFLAGQGATVLYTSDLLRAWATAEAIGRACGLTPRREPGLRERRCGVFEGLTVDEAKRVHPAWSADYHERQVHSRLGDGESLVDLRQRVVDALESIVRAHPGETLIVVTHGGVLDIVNRFVRGTDLALPRDFAAPNAGINWISLHGGRWQIDDWALTAHLEVALDEL